MCLFQVLMSLFLCIKSIIYRKTSVPCCDLIFIPFQTHCLTIKQWLSILPPFGHITTNLLSVSVALSILDILYRLPLCYLDAHRFAFFQWHSPYLILFWSWGMHAAAKNLTTKVKYRNNWRYVFLQGFHGLWLIYLGHCSSLN